MLSRDHRSGRAGLRAGNLPFRSGVRLSSIERRAMPRVSAFIIFGFATLALAATTPPGAPLLPQEFGGWREAGTISTAPDPGDAAMLKEYGLAQYAGATYALGSHRLTVRAMRFADATGAFGAFTIERQPQMHALALGREGASAGDHFVFWTGTTVVDATFASSVPGEAAALNALNGQLPAAAGTQSIPPSLPHYLPAMQLNATSVRYAIGPAGYARAGGTLPANVVDFSQDTEAVLAEYGSPGAQEMLTLLLYPTPQIAGAHLKAVDAAKSAGMTAVRSGPLVAIANGSFSAAKAEQLVREVQFNDAVTINHFEGYVSETMKLYRLLFGVTMMVVVLISAALLLGIFLGGGRALVRKLQGKPVSSVSEEEFISLHLGG